MNPRGQMMPQSVRTWIRPTGGDRGFIMIEVVLTLILIAIAISPMLSAFTPALRAAGVTEETAVFSGRAAATLNRVAALDFALLDAHRGDPVNLAALFGSQAEAGKESFSFRGQTYAPIVAISDASGGAGGLLKLTVVCDEIAYTSLRTGP
jgi:type II secretory pathway pseudopilin PulG